jgi:hypothetical protein
MDEHGRQEHIGAKIDEANRFLEGLESGKLQIGAPSESRTGAKIHDLKRQIAMLEKVLDNLEADRA